METFLRKLRTLGPAGAFVANVLTFLTTNWILVGTVLVSIYTGASEWATNLALQPWVQAAVLVWLSLFWTYIGFVLLYDRRHPRIVKTYQDYSYGLTYEGIAVGYDPHNEDATLQIGVQLRNFSNAPVRYAVDLFDLRIGTRALPKAKKGQLSAYMARGAGRRSSNVPFKAEDLREYNGKKVEGTLDVLILYGHPQVGPVRQLRVSHTLSFDFTKKHLIEDTYLLGIGDNIKEEVDEPIQTPPNSPPPTWESMPKQT